MSIKTVKEKGMSCCEKKCSLKLNGLDEFGKQTSGSRQDNNDEPEVVLLQHKQENHWLLLRLVVFIVLSISLHHTTTHKPSCAIICNKSHLKIILCVN